MAASPSPRPAPGGLDLREVALGLAVLALVTAVDVALKTEVTLTPFVLIAPLVVATRGMERDTAAVAGVAFLVSILLGEVNGKFGSSLHVAHMVLVVAGGALAVFTTRVRQRLTVEQERAARLLYRERAERVRQEFASRASRLLESPLDPLSMLAQVTGLAVPDMADLCIVDLLEPDGRLRGVATSAIEPSVGQALRDLRQRQPLDPTGEHPVAIAARTGESQLLAELPEDNLRRFAASDEHFELMCSLRYRSAIVTPLTARGRTLGVLSLLRLGNDVPYDEQDLAVARDLSRRAALAMDNARLFTELRRTEGQLEGILANLAEAVTVQDSSGELIYANQAAAALMGADTPEELVTTPVDVIRDRFWQFTEEGERFPADGYPGRAALRGERPDPVVIRQVDRATRAERWVRMRATPILEGDETLAVTVTEDVTEVKRSELAQRFLAAATKLLASSLDIDATVDKVAWSVVPEVADWCVVHMPDERGELRQVAVAHMDPAKLELARRMQAQYLEQARTDRGTGRVMLTGESELYEHIPDDLLAESAQDAEQLEVLRALGLRSVVIAPLVAGQRTIGTITLVTAQEGRRLDRRDLALAEELGRRAGVAIENARVHAVRSHIASTLQRSLLPPRLPVIPGLTIAARFRAAGTSTEVGGDFYDLFPAARGWMVVIGDVTGKGPTAAAITSLARYTMRTAAMYEHEPGAVLRRLNDALLGDSENRRLCTAVCVHVEQMDRGRARVRLACAGHPSPFLLCPGREPQLVGPPGTLLGAFEDGAWREVGVELAEGDTLLLYTDGVTDTRGRSGRFGQERLAALLGDVGSEEADDIAMRVDRALLAFEEGPQRDDVALLVLRAGSDPGAETSIVGASAGQSVSR